MVGFQGGFEDRIPREGTCGCRSSDREPGRAADPRRGETRGSEIRYQRDQGAVVSAGSARAKWKVCAIALALLATPAVADQTSVPTSEINARELQAIVDERTKAIHQRFDLESRANAQRFEAQEKAVAAALAAAKEAVAKAEGAAEKRFDSVNEFRGNLKDQQATFIPRTEVDVRFKSIEAKIADNEMRINQIVSRAEGSAQLWQGITVALGIGIAATTLIIAFRKRAAA
jgi:hypothetical protein